MRITYRSFAVYGPPVPELAWFLRHLKQLFVLFSEHVMTGVSE